MQSDVDTSDRAGDGARTTPPATPAPRAPGAPASATPPGSGASSSTTSTPSSPTGAPATGASTSGSPATGAPATPASGAPATSAPAPATGSPATPGAATTPNSTFGGGSATSTESSTAGLVPAARPAGGGRSGLNGGRDGAAPAARPDVQPLLDAEYAATVRERWFGVQSAFVDDPESAVREASVVLEDSIAAIGRGLEKLRRSVTDSAEAAEGTEDLRVALLRHREVIGRLLQL
ncbi:hypothetical protein [Cryptosporangium minutisporangium]|uniref:hypothetical protein n=1 Tax=Cryptosporangium minutisporangium TaxID=113569 RepID=UPI0031E68B31